MFPRPTEYPMMLRKNCIFPDHAARSGSSAMTTCFSSPSVSSREARWGGDSTIVTPWRPSPRAFVLSGVISWPFFGNFNADGGVVIWCQSRPVRLRGCDYYRTDVFCNHTNTRFSISNRLKRLGKLCQLILHTLPPGTDMTVTLSDWSTRELSKRMRNKVLTIPLGQRGSTGGKRKRVKSDDVVLVREKGEVT